jgi:hypothetical protein
VGIHIRAALALVLAAVLSGCATTGSNPYPYFERLAIEALPPAPVKQNDAVASAGKLAAGGAAAGGMGVLASGLVTSLLCGPYFAVCFAGTSAAALGSEELAAAVSGRLPAKRLAVTTAADARLGLEAQGLRVALGLEDSVALWIAVKANLRWELDRPEPRQTSRTFACQTELLPLEDWLSSRKKDADKRLSFCIDDLGLQIWTALQKPSIEPDTDSASPVGFGNYDPATGNW